MDPENINKLLQFTGIPGHTVEHGRRGAIARHSWPDKDGIAMMSSRLSPRHLETAMVRMPLIALLLLTAGASAQTEAPVYPSASPYPAGAVVQPVPATTQPTPWSQVSGRIGVASDPAISATISQWRALQQSDGLGFSTYANFILANPGWPGEDRMRRLAETSINPNSYDPRQVTAFFARFPARTAAGNARNALALMQMGRMAEARMQMAEAVGVSDAGYIADKATWLINTGNWIAARQYLANRPTLTFRPGNAEKWYETLLGQARAAANDSQWSFAYGIASKLDDAYAPGVDVSSRPIGERDDYTSLAWLAGSTAFYNLNRPSDAAAMFRRYATAAKSPQTQSKGYYWAGRAALAAGDTATANSYFAQASVFPDQFYGQLALERVGKPVPAPALVERPVEISAAERMAFNNRSVVRAVKALGQMGYWEDQSKFARAIANNADSDSDHYLAAELAKSIGRPDMGVMVGRRAVSSGLTGYGESAFPRVPVPPTAQSNWTMVHAIARQESQFDRQIVSHAGARGLMQLMPGTAREQAGKLGLGYDPGSLNDPSYNIMLGSSYFQRMLDYYGGSYPLAVAAYNAGPGNVNRWIAANGDPRMPGADMLRWIEQIPLFETRNYVQRVLENAVVYEAMNPERARFRGSNTPLSKYLGKQTPG
jgi:soluble lytic murein transglycosylase